MALINTGSIAKLLRPGLNSIVGLNYNMYAPEWAEIFDSVQASNMNYEEDIVMYGLGIAPVKQQGAPMEFDAMQQAAVKQYIHITYGIGYAITREAVEDNLYPKQAIEIAQQIAFSCRQTKEILCANMLNTGNSASGTGATWDGQPLFSNTHTLAKGGTYNNQLLTPADLSEAALEQALIDIGGMLNDAGQHIALQAQKLIIPVALQFEANRITDSQLRYNTAENAINAIRNMGMLPGGTHVNHYLTSPSAWFIKTDAPKGFRLFDRRPLEVDNDTPDFYTENMSFKGTFRMSLGCTEWRAGYASFGP